jgi:hypothetical protein
MEQIKEERRGLQDEYFQHMKRLSELDQQERQAYDVESILGSLVDHTNKLLHLIPPVDTNKAFDVAVQQIKEQITETSSIGTVLPIDEPPIIPKQEIVKLQEKELDIKGRKRNHNSILDVALNIITILKESDRPFLKPKQINEELYKRFNYRYANISAVMKRAIDLDDRIEKIAQGSYRYA